MRKLSIKDIINYVSEDSVYNIVCVDNAFGEEREAITTTGGNWAFVGRTLAIAIGEKIVWMEGEVEDDWLEKDGKNHIMKFVSRKIEYAVERGEMKNIVDVEEIFNLDLKMAVFHHHDLQVAFIEGEDDVEFYEFSHIPHNVFYKALIHGDARFISALLKRNFLKEKIVLVDDKTDLEHKRHWLCKTAKGIRLLEELQDPRKELLWKVKLLLGPREVVPDPKRQRKEHEKIIDPVTMYQIPSLFGEVEVE